MSQNLINSIPEEFAGLDTDDMKVRNIGMVIVFITFVVFGIWSMVAPLGSAAIAPGFLAVKSHTKTVQHLEGGIVKRLLVREGDSVEAGDVLVVLDDTQINAQLEIVRNQYFSAAAVKARLFAETAGIDAVAYPDEWTENFDQKIKDSILRQNHIFETRKDSRESEISILELRVEQLKEQVLGLKKQRKSKLDLSVQYESEINDIKELLSEGFSDKQKLLELERSSTRNIGDTAALESDIAATEIQVGETRLQILQKVKEFQESIAQDLSLTQDELFKLLEQKQALEDRVKRTDIKAPVSGKVLGLAIYTEGGVVPAAKPILDIVPQGEGLIIESRVSPNDIDRVSVGMTAEIRLSAFKRETTPRLDGTVITLSADNLTDEGTGQSYFLARVEISPESYIDLDGLQLQAGMPAEVLINTGKRTLFQYIVQPFTNMFARSLTED